MVRLVLIAQALQDEEGIIQRRFIDLHRLETTLQRGILFDVLAVLIQGGSTDGLQLAAGQLGLEQRSGVDGTFGSTGTDEGVDLVDEQDDVPALVNFFKNLLQAFLKVTAVAGTGDQRTQVKRVKLLVLKGFWDLAVDNVQRQALNYSGLTNAGLTDEHRVVLRAAREHLHDALNLRLAANDGV